MPMGGTELLVILAIILLFFGARRVPQLARSLGRAKHEMHKGIEESEAEAKKEEEERKKAEAQQDKEESPASEGAHPEDGRVPEGEKPKAGPDSKA
jgi:sec-independent protein translocase protein TatA